LVTAGKAAEGQGNGATAAKLFEQAVALDPLDADLQYRWGKCLLQMTNLAAARTHFQLACDNDAVPARTDSHLNGLIRQEAQRFAGGSLALLEAPDVLAADSAAGICGSETFFEHVHFNPNGSYRLGRAWAERAAGFLPDGHPAAPWFSEEKCERRLAMTDWNRRNDLNEMVNRRHAAPLNAQSNNAQQLAELEQTLVALSKRLDADGVSQARQICLESIQRRPQDLDLHGNYADFLEAIGSFQEAAEQWQLVQQLRPDYYLGYFQAGRMLERLGQLESARDAFQQTVLRRPTMGPAWFELGNIDASLGHWDDALQEVECASRWQSHLPAYYACMGKILARLNRHPEAVARYRQALQADDNYWDGHIALGGELAGAGDWLAAQTEFAAGVRLRPDSVVAHLELGAALASQSQQAAAQREMTQVLQLDPSNQTAQAWLTRWHRN
jgi:tetratricopeptide (TPR) repeat protein